jgi:hypothetical protein
MYSWLHDALKMVRSYFVVELIFGLWGLACGYAVFVLKLNENVGMAVAIVGGFLTALPAWSYLSRVPSLPVTEMASLTIDAEPPTPENVRLSRPATAPADNNFYPVKCPPSESITV